MPRLKRAHRWWLGAVIALIALPLLLVALLLWVVDPDSLRPAIEKQARTRLGLPLHLTGPLHWKLWPALAVQSGAGAVGADGSEAPLSWQNLAFTLKWTGLGQPTWRVEGLQIEGLRLVLAEDAAGQWNIASLLGGAANAGAGSQATAALTIQPLTIRNARIEVRRTGDRQPWVVAPLDVSLRLDVDPGRTHWLLRDVHIQTGVSGPDIAQPSVTFDSARVSVDAHANINTVLELAPANLRWGSADAIVQVAGPLQIQPLAGEGELRLQTNSLRAQLLTAGIPLPPTRDGKVLQTIVAATHWRVTADTAALSALQLQLDDTQWQGMADLHWQAPQSWKVALQGDALDLDRYLRPASDPGEPFSLPTATLRALPLTGTLQLRELRASGSVAQDVRIELQ